MTDGGVRKEESQRKGGRDRGLVGLCGKKKKQRVGEIFIWGASLAHTAGPAYSLAVSYRFCYATYTPRALASCLCPRS